MIVVLASTLPISFEVQPCCKLGGTKQTIESRDMGLVNQRETAVADIEVTRPSDLAEMLRSQLNV